MRVTEYEQRSPEWYAARLGVPTASNFGKFITPTGKPSAQARGYIHQLVAERITGTSKIIPVNEAMQHGIDLEPEARQYYELCYDVKVFELGLCLHDSLDVGASPDGLVGENGLIEIKCPYEDHVQIEYLDNKKLPDRYKAQVMGQLWITEREWCDFFAYHKTISPFLIRVYRDEEYISQLAECVTEAIDVIQLLTDKYSRK